MIIFLIGFGVLVLGVFFWLVVLGLLCCSFFLISLRVKKMRLRIGVVFWDDRAGLADGYILIPVRHKRIIFKL